MRRVLPALAAFSLAFAVSATASAQPAKVYRVGVITTPAPQDVRGVVTELDEGLRDLGYVEGKNLVIERRSAEGRPERLDALATELVRLNVDVIVTGSNPVIRAVKRATATIPIVMAVSRDPVGAGFVASLSRPGGNITGMANEPGPEILGKNVEILKEAAPKTSRVAVLLDPSEEGAAGYRAAVEHAAGKLGMSVVPVEARGRDDLEGAFATIKRERAKAVVVLPHAVLFATRSEIARLAVRDRVPAMYGNRAFPESGGLMAYGPNVASQFRRAAFYVDKILKGTRPGDLAVEQPVTFELVINLKAATAIGLAIPASLRQRADRLIE